MVFDRMLSRRPLTASERDQELFAAVPELDVLRGSERLGLNVYVGGAPGSGKTTLLRRFAYEHPEVAVFARAEPAGSVSGLLQVIASASGLSTGAVGPVGNTELDLAMLETIVSTTLARWERGAARPRVVLVDGASREQVRVLFGRYRDALWELPLAWIVAGRPSAPPPPSDSFFDRSVRLTPWPRRRIREMIALRVPDWPAEWCDEAASLLAPATPARSLLDFQTLVLSDNHAELLRSFADERSQVAGLPDRLRRLYEALSQSGPIHAGDQWLLDVLGVSRSRIVHGLKELESEGLVRAERDGRRVRYTSRRHSLLDDAQKSKAAGSATPNSLDFAAVVGRLGKLFQSGSEVE